MVAQKTDRFGWDRNRETPVQDRLIIDWMDALQDFTIEEIRGAIAACLDAKPGRTPNERDVLFQVHKLRARDAIKPYKPPGNINPPPTEEEKARMNAFLAEVGFRPKRMQEIDDPAMLPEIKAAVDAAEKAAEEAAAAADAAMEKRIMEGNG